MQKMICNSATTDAVKEQQHSPSKTKQKKKAKPQNECEVASGIGVLVALEPRIMFDGAALATGAEVLQASTTSDHTAMPGIDGETKSDSATPAYSDDGLWSSGLSLSVSADRKEIVFIDTSVDDYQTLMESIDSNAEVILLDSTRDGVEQIAEILGQRSDIDAVHIISHGDQGSLWLGTGRLNVDTMQGEYADELTIINESLNEEADFLIYGCNFGEGEIGQKAAQALARLTGADLAASNDLTGHASLGGDWELEVQIGNIETDDPFDATVEDGWVHVLAPTIDSTSSTVNDGNEITTISHTTAGDDRLLLVGISVERLGAASGVVDSVTYNGVNLSFVGAQQNGRERVEIWSLVAPDTGTHDVVVVETDPNGNIGNAIGVMTFTGVDQATPLGTFSSATGSGSTTGGSVTVSSAADELVFGVVSHGSQTLTSLNPAGTGQVEAWEHASSNHTGAGSTQTGAASTNVSWTWDAQSGDFAIAGVSIKPISNDAPVLTPSTPSFPTITEDATSNSGSLISAIVTTDITDPDSGASEGIALTDLTSGNGTWQYDTGSGWTAVGTVTDTSALLLRATDSLRFVPDAQNADTATVTYRAWDQTSGAVGTKVDVSSNGGSSAFSSVTDTASLAVTAVNDAPVLDNTGTMTLTNIAEDDTSSVGDTVAAIIGSAGGDRITDVDSGAVEGLAVIGVDDTNGTWQYNTGSGWTAFGAVTNTTAVLLDSSASIRFVPDAHYTGSAGALTVRAWDTSTGSTGDTGVDVSTHGTTTAYSTATETASLTVTPVNDAPVNTVPGAQNTNEDTNLVFSAGNGNAIAITDPDSSGDAFEVTLSVTNGTLSLSGTTGLTFVSGDGTTDSSMTFRSTVTNINTALNGLTFIPTTDYNGGATLTLVTRDNELVSLDIDANLQARYIFQGNANDVAPGTAQNGTLTNGATITTDGTRGQVLSLDGANDYVDLSTHTTDFAGLSQGSISGWIKSTGTNETIFSISDTADTGSYAALLLGASGYLTYEVAENGVMQLAVYKSDIAINDGNWHHVAVTIGSSGNTLYVDGVAATGGQVTYDTGNATTQHFFSSVSNLDSVAIGRNQDSSGGKWYTTGNLDDTRIYNRALTETEIVNLAMDLSLIDTDTVTITVNPQNDAPVLDNTGTMTLTSIAEDDTSSAGDTVAAIIGSAGGDRITDVDSGAVEGLAVIGVDDTNGTWQYNTGSGWTAFGAVTNTTAVLLDSSASIRFVPDAHYTGSAGALTVRAWDTSTGSTGDTGVDVSTHGTTTAYSTATETASLTVTAVNDEPIFTNLDGNPTFVEDGPAVTLDGNVEIFDEELSNINDFEDATLLLRRNGGADSDDVFSAGGNLVFNAGNLELSSVNVGTYANFSGTLVMSFVANTTNAQVNEVMQSIQYSNSSDTPPVSVQIDWTFNDQNTASAQGSGGALETTYTMTVDVTAQNDVPTAANQTVTTLEDTDHTFTAANFNFSDIDGDALASVTITTLESAGALQLSGADVTLNQVIAKADIDAGNLKFVPVANANGLGYDSFGFSVNDGTVDSAATYTLTVDVTAQNDVPVNTVPGGQTVNEDTSLNIAGISVADVDNTLLTVQLEVNNGTLNVTPSGTVTISAGTNGTGSITLFGSQADINATLATLIYQGNLHFVGNDTLTIESYDQTLYALDFDTNLKGYYQFESADPGNDSSPAGTADGTLMGGATVVSDPTRGDVIQLDGIDDHVLISGMFGEPASITMAAWVNLQGPDAVGAEVFNLGNNVGIRLDKTDGTLHAFFYEGTIWQTLDPSGIVAGTGWRHVAATYNGNTGDYAFYLDGVMVDSKSGGSPLSYTVGSSANTFIGRHDTVNTLDFDGLIDDARIYDRALSGSEIQDLASATVATSDTDTVAITVTPVNDAPLANDDSFTTFEDTPIAATLATGVLANDTDVDGDTLNVNTIPIVDVSNGALVLNTDGSFTYTPNAGWSGTDTFTYQITDGNGGSAQAIVTLTVISVNDSPVITSHGGGTSASVTVAENLTNVTAITATDSEGDPLTYSIVGGADAGRFAVDSSSGALRFVAAPDFENPTDVGGNQIYDVQVQVSDGQGGTDTQTLAITVTDVLEGTALPPSPDPDPTPEPHPEPISEPEPTSDVNSGVLLNATLGEGVVSGTIANGDLAGRGLENEASKLGNPKVVNVLDLPPLLRPASWATTSDQIRSYYPDPLDMTQPKISTEFLQQLKEFSDELGETVKEQADERSWFVNSIKSAGLTLTTAFVAWLVRGGVLVAGLMASLPSWRYFDPVPILNMSKEDKEVWAKRANAAAQLEAHEHEGLTRILHGTDQSTPPSAESKPKS